MTRASQSATSPEPTLFRLVVTVFLPFSGGYFMSYLVRSVHAVIAPQLVQEIGLHAGALGLLTSAYFLAFASFQLPLGLLLDRFGPRRVQSVLLLSAALGALLFSQGNSHLTLVIARAFIGLGFAGGLMSSFKAITLWFPERRWPLVNGFFLGMGGLGAMSATRPVEALLGIADWRSIFLGFAVAIVCVSSIIILVVPESRGQARTSTLGEQIAGLRIVFRDRFFWRVAPVSITSMAVGLGVQGLWAGPWLRDVAHLSRDGVAGTLFALTVGLTVGMVSSGLLAEGFGRLGIGLLGVMKGGLAVFFLGQVVIVFEWVSTSLWPWVLFGFISNICVLAYAQLSVHFPRHYTATANAGLNVLVMFGAFTVQYGIGAIIDLWPPAPSGGYLPAAYQGAFGTMLLIQLVTYLWLFVPHGKSSGQG